MQLDLEGNTMLILCVKAGHAEALDMLLQAGALPSQQNESGNTALHYAIAFGYTRCVQVLIQNGASENIENNQGKKPWEIQPTKQ